MGSILRGGLVGVKLWREGKKGKEERRNVHEVVI